MRIDAVERCANALGRPIALLAAAATVAGLAALGLGILGTFYFICKMARGGSCFGDSDKPSPGCQSAPGNSGSGTTGMGSAPPPGGNGSLR